MKVSAFIPSLVIRRGPIFEGLPTLEKHRTMSPYLAAKHLFALGIEDVIFGDSVPTFEELKTVGRVKENVLEFCVQTFQCSEMEKKIIFECAHADRPDPAEDVIRSTNSRTALNSGHAIEPFNTIRREKGSITIDNKDYLRYCGELQVCKKDLPQDARVNVVGKIIDSELTLLDFIQEETKFTFIEENEFLK